MLKSFFFYIILLIDIIISINVIALKFVEVTEDFNGYESKVNYISWFLDKCLEYKIISQIKIGTPPKLIPFFINFNLKIFGLRISNQIEHLFLKKNNNSNEYYIPSKSSSFTNITKIMRLEPFFSFSYSLINETIRLCIDKECNNEIEIKNIQFYIENLNGYNNKIKENNSNIITELNYSYKYGELGFSFSQSTNTQPLLFEELKSLGIINALIITVEYTKKNEGTIYIGDFPHIYNNNLYKENQFMTAYSYPEQGYISQLNLRFNRLYLINKNSEYIDLENNIIYFNYGLGIIFSTRDYYNKIIDIFFKAYFNKDICFENIIKKEKNKYYYLISCINSEDFKIEDFPTLFLFKEEFKYIFELNYKDLFEEDSGIYNFLVVYCPFADDNFELGKPFLKNYKITYNSEINAIHFYNYLLKKNNNDEYKNIDQRNKTKIYNIIAIIFILGLFIITIVLIILLNYLKKIFRKRKLRTNEIDDKYEYDYKINN